MACRAEPVTLGIASGPQTVDGAILALEEARASGVDVPVDTVVVREQTNLPTEALGNAEVLADTPGLVAVMGHANSAASIAAAPLYNRAHVVQLASHSTAEAYSAAGPFSFRMVPPDSQQGRIIAEYMTEEFPGARIALGWVNDDYGRGLRSALLDALPTDSLDMVVDVPHTESASEDVVRRSVLAMADAKPDVILWLSRGRELQRYLPGVRERLGRIPVVGGDGLASAEFLRDPEGLFPPLHFVRLVDLDARPETRRFSDRYRARFGVAPADAAALAYDAFAVLLAGVQAGVRSGEEMRDYLHSLGRSRPAYPGITGPIQFDRYGDASRDYVMGHMLEPDQTGNDR